MTITIDIGVEGDRLQVEALLKSAYSQSAQFKLLDHAQLQFAASETSSFVIARDGNCIVGCMSFTLLRDPEHGISVMEAIWNTSGVAFPALLLGRAATDAAYRRRRIHQALRYALFSRLRPDAIGSIVDIVHGNTPHLSSLERIGYRRILIVRYWYTDIESLEQPFVVHLSAQALAAHFEAFAEMFVGVDDFEVADDFDDKLSRMRTATPSMA